MLTGDPEITCVSLEALCEEDLKTIVLPMCLSGKEAMGSMGTDTPLAVLSNKPQLLFNYFKQLFAQVTNPPLDGIREEIVTDTSLGLGSDYNIYDIVPEHCKKLKINNPIISNEDLDKIKFIKSKDFKAASISALYDLSKGHNGIEEALDKMVLDASKRIDEGYNIIILSDRGVSKKMGAIPILLACSNIHHCMMKLKKRSKFGIVIESSEPREPTRPRTAMASSREDALLFGMRCEFPSARRSKQCQPGGIRQQTRPVARKRVRKR